MNDRSPRMPLPRLAALAPLATVAALAITTLALPPAAARAADRPDPAPTATPLAERSREARPQTVRGKVMQLDAATFEITLLVAGPDSGEDKAVAPSEERVRWSPETRFVWRADEQPADTARRARMASGGAIPPPGSSLLHERPKAVEPEAAAEDLAIKMRVRAKGTRDAQGTLLATDLWLEPLPAVAPDGGPGQEQKPRSGETGAAARDAERR